MVAQGNVSSDVSAPAVREELLNMLVAPPPEAEPLEIAVTAAAVAAVVNSAAASIAANAIAALTATAVAALTAATAIAATAVAATAASSGKHSL